IDTMKHLGTVTLETERLVLRKTIESDYEPMFRNWANDERVTRFLTWAPYESAEQLKNTYQELICKGWFLPPNTYMTAAHLW
ncbi:MAG: GNAT family protein, partial [Clostridia bacterium]|nr:GNAT family protein [Clostridia bacterium]